MLKIITILYCFLCSFRLSWLDVPKHEMEDIILGNRSIFCGNCFEIIKSAVPVK